ncbi:unnamed protein product [Albugo candida]|uniref:Uncharacterized protein n=1 Tax=Albugo candida TaxID=65357 RepID=A0A024GPT9_9STRA|nr:unnamed protein product [Albugo candida]|eukprot:CCI48556.1 unnamed protein product [Albugo candida]
MQWKVCELHRVASLETSLMKGSISHCRAIRHTTREALLSHSYLTRSLRNVMNSNHASCPLLKDSVLRPRRYFRSMGTAFAHLAPFSQHRIDELIQHFEFTFQDTHLHPAKLVQGSKQKCNQLET